MEQKTNMDQEAPRLISDRLILRAHRLDDFVKSAAMWADENVVRHIGGQVSTEQQSWSRFLNYAGHWKMLGFGYWVIEEKSSGQFIGEVGFADFHRVVNPSISGIPEAGWALITSAHGKGFATEALMAAHSWRDVRVKEDSTACMIAPENRASVRVAEKCGYNFWTKGTYQSKEIILMKKN